MARLGIDGARMGDPCYAVCTPSGEVVGFGIARGLMAILERKERVCELLWAYIRPEHRNGWIASLMRATAIRAAKHAGYARTDTFTLNGRAPVGAEVVRTQVTFRYDKETP